MENYKDLVLQNEIGNIQMIRPIKGISIIEENPIGVLEKLGKYEFIYDYRVPNFWDKLMFSSTPMSLEKSLVPQSNLVKEGGSNAKMIAPNTIWSGQSFPQPVKVNSEPQVGTFSKGNIVNVLRFDGNNAIIQNPNFVEPDPNAPKVGFFSNFGDLKKQKEFSIPKDYLRKVDDTLAVTVSTGILYGANMKPQPVIPIPPYKPLPNLNPITQTILEENASFVLNKDFQYISGYGSSYCSPDGLCTADMSPKYSTLKAGTKVTGSLFRKPNNMYNVMVGYPTPPPYNDFLQVKGYGNTGSINIPIEYLTREVTTNTNNNNGVVLPVEDNNKNLLMILGAFLVGYLLFNNDTPTT
jgi:hypothetical protein